MAISFFKLPVGQVLNFFLADSPVHHLFQTGQGNLFIFRARDAQLSMKDNKVHLVQDRDGRYLDTNLTKEALENWDGIQAINLPVFNRPADVQAKALEKMDSILGEFTSDYGSSEKNRKFNIALGSRMPPPFRAPPGQAFMQRLQEPQGILEFLSVDVAKEKLHLRLTTS